jgi:aspartyl protease family protein
MLRSLGLALVMTVLPGLPGFTPVAGARPDTFQLMAVTELEATKNGHFVTEAFINNRAVRVLVDTGATAVALSFEDAVKTGLSPQTLAFDVPVSTANGEARAARVMLREVEIDNVRVHDVEGLVLQKGALNGTLLGMTFLSRLRSFSVENGKLLLKN